MLKLEKRGNTRELSILIRTKTTLFTRPFIFALGYAIFIHFIGLFIFQIAPFKISYQHSVFSPVNVATEVPIHHGVYASNEHLEEKKPISNYLIAPIPEKPTIQSPCKLSPLRKMEYIKQKSPLNNPFLALENKLESEITSTSSKLPPITIHLSGPIAELSLQSQNTYEAELATLASTHGSFISTSKFSFFRFHFNVQIEQKNGEIFWWEMTKVENNDDEKSEKIANINQDLQDYALKVLKSLQFSPQPSQFILGGGIEIDLILGALYD